MLITTKTTISVVTFFRLAVYVTKGLIPKDHCQTSLPATKLFSHRCKKFLCTHMILPGKRVPVRTHFTLVLSGKSIFYLPFPPLPFIIFILFLVLLLTDTLPNKTIGFLVNCFLHTRK